MFLADFAKICSGKILPTPIILSILVGAIWLHLPLSKAHGFLVCERAKAQCKVGDLTCAAAVTAAFAACETKIHAYNIYMGNMGSNVTTYQFPHIYRDILGRRYSQTHFNSVRFGFSDKQPPKNNTTDCNVIYFSNAQFVNDLRSASAHSSWHLLLHELTHTEQCTVAGNREGYAKRWWDEMEAALAAQGRKVNVLQPPEELAKQLGELYMQGHDMMPMERQADKKADGVLLELRGCCIADGSPIRPLTVSGIDERPDGGSSIRRILRVGAVNGAPPFTTRWWVKSPGDINEVEQPRSLIKGVELLWTPINNPQNARVVTTSLEQRRVWDHKIRVELLQATPRQLIEVSRTISFSERVFVNLPKSGPQFDKLPAELPPSKLPDLGPSVPEKPGPRPGPLPARPSAGP